MHRLEGDQDVVITSMAIASPLGGSLSDFTRGLLAGDSAVSDIRNVTVAADFPVPYAGLLRFSPDTRLLDNPSGSSPFVRLAAHLLSQIQVDLPEGVPVDGLVLGTGEGLDFGNGVAAHRESDFSRVCEKELFPEHSLNFLMRQLEARGHGRISPRNSILIFNACASGNVAIGTAFERIRAGFWRRALVGSWDLRCEAPYLMSFFLLGALSDASLPAERASCPFSKRRCGFVKSEGGGLLLLETRAEARKRGAVIHGVVSGFGISSDGWRITDGRDDGRGAVQAMQFALADAEMAPADIQYINAHGTSTRMNDLLETNAIKSVFGKQAYSIPTSSIKSQIGHSAVGAGLQEAIASVVMLRHQIIAPTINYDEPDPLCDLDYVPNTARAAVFSTVLSNSFGFGGQNACIIIKRD